MQSECGLREVHDLELIIFQVFGIVLKIGAMSGASHISWDALTRFVVRRGWKEVNQELKSMLVRIVGVFRVVHELLEAVCGKLNQARRQQLVETARAVRAVGP